MEICDVPRACISSDQRVGLGLCLTSVAVFLVTFLRWVAAQFVTTSCIEKKRQLPVGNRLFVEWIGLEWDVSRVLANGRGFLRAVEKDNAVSSEF